MSRTNRAIICLYPQKVCNFKQAGISNQAETPLL